MLDRKPAGGFAPASSARPAGAPSAQSPAQSASPQPEEIPTIQIDENQDEVKIEDIPF